VIGIQKVREASTVTPKLMTFDDFGQIKPDAQPAKPATTAPETNPTKPAVAK
jgi:hypothetical protein